MAELRLLTSPNCALCDHSKQVLGELAAEGFVAWREVPIDSDEGARLAACAPPLRPVLFDGERVAGYGRLSKRRLRRQLG